MPFVISAELAGLIQSLRSLWAVELLLLLQRRPDRVWPVDDLVGELRSSRALVDSVLSRLHELDMVERLSDGSYRYRCASTANEELVSDLSRLHAERPLAIAQALHGGPDEKLRAFSDAFRLKKD